MKYNVADNDILVVPLHIDPIEFRDCQNANGLFETDDINLAHQFAEHLTQLVSKSMGPYFDCGYRVVENNEGKFNND